MDSRERVKGRFGLAMAAVIAAGAAFAFWRNSVADGRARVAAYTGGDGDPSRAGVIAAVVVTVMLVVALAVWWRTALRRLDGPPQSGAGVAGELERLTVLRDSGALSAEEFTAAKSRALGEQHPGEPGLGRQ